MHPKDEMSLHQSETPFGKNNYVKSPPIRKKKKKKKKKKTIQSKKLIQKTNQYKPKH